jgi:hypothetical protein
MKFNLEFNFEDLEFDEGNISEMLKNSIQNDLVYKLKKEIEEKTMIAISSAVRTTIENQMNEIISAKIREIIETGKIKPQYGSEPISINEHIEYVFGKTDLNRKTSEFIEKSCKSFVDEIKKSYDLAFASHIVKNMQANNLLKDNVADLLLTK